MINFKQILIVASFGAVGLSTALFALNSFKTEKPSQLTPSNFIITSTEKLDPIVEPLVEFAPQSIIESAKPLASTIKTSANKIAPQPKVAGTNITPTPSSSSCSGRMAEEFLCLLNQYRDSKGKTKLGSSSALSSVALGHSTWMSNSGSFSHVGVNGSRLNERCSVAGITCRAENLAHNIGSAQQLLDLWKVSPSHNANLLGAYSTLGYGSYNSYITILFN